LHRKISHRCTSCSRMQLGFKCMPHSRVLVDVSTHALCFSGHSS
jgi:hypothetical protein